MKKKTGHRQGIPQIKLKISFTSSFSFLVSSYTTAITPFTVQEYSTCYELDNFNSFGTKLFTSFGIKLGLGYLHYKAYESG